MMEAISRQKLLFSELFRKSGVLRIYEKFKKPGVVIINYHRILPFEEAISSYSRSMIIEKDVFEKQMFFISKYYQIISLSNAVDMLENRTPIASNSIVVTFDDGYLSNYLHAFPILKKYGVPATIFVSTNSINSNEYLWWDELAYCIRNMDKEKVYRDEMESNPVKAVKMYLKASNHSINNKVIDGLISVMNSLCWTDVLSVIQWFRSKLKEVPQKRSPLMLNWQQIQEMSSFGIAFGCHTSSHPFLDDIPESVAYQEIIDSKREIESKIGKQIDLFAFPSGKFNHKIISMLKECGFRAAVTTKIGRNGCDTDFFQLNRKDAGYLTFDGSFYESYFFAEMSGIFDIFRN
ncbi:MAG: polysaccharide deacetylase family protein [Thermodesulfovibrionia bacterium]|nr:polysaccharide deacetylase family protein [Thermodesulfovibrionia bacterium]